MVCNLLQFTHFFSKILTEFSSVILPSSIRHHPSYINHLPSSLFLLLSTTQPSCQEGFDLPPAPSLSRDGSNRDYSSLIH